MDNNTQDPGLALDIAGVMRFANNIIKKVETRSGLNIPEDKKEEFEKSFKANDGDKLIGDLKNKKLEQHLQKIVLHFEFKDSKLPIDVPFFDHIENSIYQLSEMDRKAKYWQTMLSKMIGSTAKHIA